MGDLAAAANTIIRDCLDLRRSEELVVITDAPTREVGAALAQAGGAAGAVVTLVEVPVGREHGAEPPAAAAAALLSAGAYLCATSKSLSHTRARRAASDAGARGATLPGVTAEMLARLMGVDFPAVAERSRAVAALLDTGSSARLTCRHGSDLRLDLEGRHAVADDGDLTAKGAFGNLPCGEGFVSPAMADGRIVASMVPGEGVLDEPVVFRIEHGELAGVEGKAAEALHARLSRHGEPGRNVAELGVGTNHGAQLTDNVLEAEKVLGTVHVAFGASDGIGGMVRAGIHEDVVITEPTLTIDGRTVLEAGRWLLDD